MMTLILSIAGVILFIAGISFAFRGYFSVPSGDAVVPRPEFDSLKRSLTALKDAELKAQNDSYAAKKEAEELKRLLSATAASEDNLRKEVDRLRQESQELGRQLAETVVKLEELKSEGESLEAAPQSAAGLGPLQEKIVDQAKGALEIIKSLQAQNEQLKKAVETEKDKAGDIRATLSQIEDEYQSKLLAAASAGGEVKEENQSPEKEKALEYELEKSRAQAATLEKICADFKAKFADFEQVKEDLKKAQNELQFLQEENKRLKRESGRS